LVVRVRVGGMLRWRNSQDCASCPANLDIDLLRAMGKEVVAGVPFCINLPQMRITGGDWFFPDENEEQRWAERIVSKGLFERGFRGGYRLARGNCDLRSSKCTIHDVRIWSNFLISFVVSGT
jgi:hypothetical protein